MIDRKKRKLGTKLVVLFMRTKLEVNIIWTIRDMRMFKRVLFCSSQEKQFVFAFSWKGNLHDINA